MIILFPQCFDLDSLLIIRAFQQLTYVLELSGCASLLLTKFDRVTWLTSERVSSQLFSVISDLVDFRLVLVLHYCGKLRSLQFVVFEVGDALLQPRVLQVESFLFEAKVEQSLLGLEETVLLGATLFLTVRYFLL